MNLYLKCAQVLVDAGANANAVYKNIHCIMLLVRKESVCKPSFGEWCRSVSLPMEDQIRLQFFVSSVLYYGVVLLFAALYKRRTVKLQLIWRSLTIISMWRSYLRRTLSSRSFDNMSCDSSVFWNSVTDHCLLLTFIFF